jgi:4'-phosphopantetheinyl transferase
MVAKLPHVGSSKSDDKPISLSVCTWALDADQQTLARVSAFLSEDELARAHRFVRERDRGRFILARGTLREIISRYLGTSPQRIEFEYAKHGKPYVVAPASPQVSC